MRCVSRAALLGTLHTRRDAAEYMAVAMAEARAMYSSVEAAADSLWQVSQFTASAALHFKNITAENLAATKALYGDEWQVGSCCLW